MRGFIEISQKYIDNKISIAVAHIVFVEETNGQAFISVGTASLKKGPANNGYYTKESYAEVLAKIEKATK